MFLPWGWIGQSKCPIRLYQKRRFEGRSICKCIWSNITHNYNESNHQNEPENEPGIDGGHFQPDTQIPRMAANPWRSSVTPPQRILFEARTLASLHHREHQKSERDACFARGLLQEFVFCSCVTFNQSLNLSEPQLLHHQNEDLTSSQAFLRFTIQDLQKCLSEQSAYGFIFTPRVNPLHHELNTWQVWPCCPSRGSMKPDEY